MTSRPPDGRTPGPEPAPESKPEFEQTAFIPGAVFKTLRYQRAPGNHYAVIGILYLHANRAGMCFPSETRIAAMVGCSDRTVRRAIRDLEEWGLVEIATGGGLASNSYWLRFVFRPRGVCEGQFDDDDELHPDTPDTGVRGGEQESADPGHPCPQPRTSVSAPPDRGVLSPRSPVSAKHSLEQSSNTSLNSSPVPRAAEERGPGERTHMSRVRSSQGEPRPVGDVIKGMGRGLAAAAQRSQDKCEENATKESR